MTHPRVFNRKDFPEGAIYIGRGSDWGNPYRIGIHGNRQEVIEKFRFYMGVRLEQEPFWLEPLRGKNLVCFCAPLECHGDVIATTLDNMTGNQ